MKALHPDEMSPRDALEALYALKAKLPKYVNIIAVASAKRRTRNLALPGSIASLSRNDGQRTTRLRPIHHSIRFQLTQVSSARLSADRRAEAQGGDVQHRNRRRRSRAGPSRHWQSPRPSPGRRCAGAGSASCW